MQQRPALAAATAEPAVQFDGGPQYHFGAMRIALVAQHGPVDERVPGRVDVVPLGQPAVQ